MFIIHHNYDNVYKLNNKRPCQGLLNLAPDPIMHLIKAKPTAIYHDHRAGSASPVTSVDH